MSSINIFGIKKEKKIKREFSLEKIAQAINFRNLLDSIRNNYIDPLIKRHKNKLAKAIKHREGVSGHYQNELNVKEDDEDEVSKLFKEKKIDVQEMDREDAITQMEMLGHDFFMFRNADTDEINVVYKRKNGAYGLIEPEF